MPNYLQHSNPPDIYDYIIISKLNIIYGLYYLDVGQGCVFSFDLCLPTYHGVLNISSSPVIPSQGKGRIKENKNAWLTLKFDFKKGIVAHVVKSYYERIELLKGEEGGGAFQLPYWKITGMLFYGNKNVFNMLRENV